MGQALGPFDGVVLVHGVGGGLGRQVAGGNVGGESVENERPRHVERRWLADNASWGLGTPIAPPGARFAVARLARFVAPRSKASSPRTGQTGA
jgi:hypothetical protein